MDISNIKAISRRLKATLCISLKCEMLENVSSCSSVPKGGMGIQTPNLLKYNPRDLSKNVVKSFNKGISRTSKELRGVVQNLFGAMTLDPPVIESWICPPPVVTYRADFVLFVLFILKFRQILKRFHFRYPRMSRAASSAWIRRSTQEKWIEDTRKIKITSKLCHIDNNAIHFMIQSGLSWMIKYKIRQYKTLR